MTDSVFANQDLIMRSTKHLVPSLVSMRSIHIAGDRMRRRVAVERYRRRTIAHPCRSALRRSRETTAELREALRIADQSVARAMRFAGIGELAAAIIHETSQSLTAVLTNSNTCLRWLSRAAPDVAQARRAAERTSRDAERATEVIAGLRALAVNASLSKAPFDIDEAIREVVYSLRGECRRNAVRVVVSLDVPSPVCGDRVQLQQVVINLLKNAIEALQPVVDRVRTVRLISQDLEGVSASIAVIDNGVGFKPSVAEQLGRTMFTTKTNGMGIGLSVSRAIVESHGGSLRATSSLEEGTRFDFNVPYAGLPHANTQARRSVSEKGASDVLGRLLY
ncbi:protein of unknown function [Pararobbsia alpina]